MTKRYISNGDWFDKGTEAELIDEFPGCDFGLFSGIHNGEPDEETCRYEEFTITEIPDRKPLPKP